MVLNWLDHKVYGDPDGLLQIQVVVFQIRPGHPTVTLGL